MCLLNNLCKLVKKYYSHRTLVYWSNSKSQQVSSCVNAQRVHYELTLASQLE